MLELLPAIGLIVVISMIWTQFWGAPWIPSSMHAVHQLLTLADVQPDDVVYDLGCGDGRIIITAARQYGARAVGIEIDPLRYLWCQLVITLLGLRDRVTLIYGSFFAQDLSGADVVICYLLQDTNLRLQSKFNRELRSGTRVASQTFTFLGMDPVRRDGENTGLSV
jgi:predicted RNA methylase